MALVAETLVDEWMNRKAFFTVRGIKDGIDEIDLLGVRPLNGGLEGWHAEVQVGFRPIGYICKLTDELAQRFGKKPTSAWQRPAGAVRECAQAWVARTFTHAKKRAAREHAWPGISWRNLFVHGVVREPDELQAIRSEGIELIPSHTILDELCHQTDQGFPAAAGTDLAEIVAYYECHRRMNNRGSG
jgi:hypothetical protein